MFNVRRLITYLLFKLMDKFKLKFKNITITNNKVQGTIYNNHVGLL